MSGNWFASIESGNMELAKNVDSLMIRFGEMYIPSDQIETVRHKKNFRHSTHSLIALFPTMFIIAKYNAL